MMKLSIGIPYYETFNLTKKLLNSLLIQMTDEVELILIDDYCKAEFHNIQADWESYNIRLVEHTENIGVAKSRNEIITNAQGKYVAFCDCDDQVTTDYVDVLLNAIDTYDTDIINFNWYDMSIHKEHRQPHNYAPWKAIYKKETMPRFSEAYEYGHEDVIFQGELDTGKYTITYLDKLLYFYNSNREGSLIWKKTHRDAT